MQIEINGIAKGFSKKQVLKNVSFCAQSGQCIGILGSNGSGKSTLLSLLAGITKADAGQFLCDGSDLLANPKKRSSLVGYVPQGTPLMEELSAKDNLRLWYDSKDMEQSLKDGVLHLLGIDEFLRVKVSKMSGGMKKRLSIGCAMANRPPILLLDEPTAALDLACKEKIFSWLSRYKQEGGLLLLTTHDAMELDLCDRWFILKDGVLEAFSYTGNVRELVEQL